MTWAGALFVVLAFVGLLDRLGIPARAGVAVARARLAVADLKNRDLDDEAKEKLVQAHATALFRLFASITALSAAAVLLPVGCVWLVAAAGLVDFDAVLAATLSWPILVAATAAGVAVIVLRRR